MKMIQLPREIAYFSFTIENYKSNINLAKNTCLLFFWKKIYAFRTMPSCVNKPCFLRFPSTKKCFFLTEYELFPKNSSVSP